MRKLKIQLFAIIVGSALFVLGYLAGTYNMAQVASQRESALLDLLNKQSTQKTSEQPTKTPAPVHLPQADYTGPQLWEAVNKARVTHGVSPLSGRDILCTIAAIRLSQIQRLGRLDDHAGFDAVFEKYKNNPEIPGNVSEFLISGYPTPDQAVDAWLNTLGHKKLITGGEYKWGCVYANSGFGVAITGF